MVTRGGFLKAVLASPLLAFRGRPEPEPEVVGKVVSDEGDGVYAVALNTATTSSSSFTVDVHTTPATVVRLG